MSGERTWLVCFLAMLAGPLAAQGTIYKCTVDGVTTYSQQACAGAKSKKIKMPPVHKPHADDVLRSMEAEQRFDAQMRESELARQEAACIDARTAATRRGTRERIDELEHQIRVAEYSMGFSANNLAGSVRSSGLQERVAALRASIASERNILASTELNARTICARQRAMAEAAARKSGAAPTP